MNNHDFFVFMMALLPKKPIVIAGMVQRGGGAGGAHAPPDFGISEGPAGSGGAPHYYVTPQIFRLWHMPDVA